MCVPRICLVTIDHPRELSLNVRLSLVSPCILQAGSFSFPSSRCPWLLMISTAWGPRRPESVFLPSLLSIRLPQHHHLRCFFAVILMFTRATNSNVISFSICTTAHVLLVVTFCLQYTMSPVQNGRGLGRQLNSLKHVQELLISSKEYQYFVQAGAAKQLTKHL